MRQVTHGPPPRAGDKVHRSKPLQNRVAPDGSLHRSDARGLFTGNRGIVHDPESKTLLGRRWTTASWIICACEWKGRKRQVWGRNGPTGQAGWTELFFLDEITALAAGHRPCFECRRQEALAFSDAFARGNGLARARAADMDRILHGERLVSRRMSAEVIAAAKLAGLPDATMVRAGGQYFALSGGNALAWDFHGYGTPVAIAAIARRQVTLVTPPTTICALAAGYRPRWHPTARP